MKLNEITNKKSLIKPSEIDKKGSEIKLPNAYDNVNYGKKKGVSRQTVTVKDTHTGKIYGRRTLHGKTTGGKGLREQELKEGGNIFKDESGTPATQRINKADVDSTLKWLEGITGLPLVDNKIGTTGTKATSGDLDVAVDETKVSKNELANALQQWAQKNFPNDNPRQWVAKSGTSVHFKTPIKGDPNNGFAQTDFMFGDPEWMKFALRGSDVDDSPFKGSHRQILMNSIAKANGLKWSFTRGLVSRETGNVITRDPQQIAEILLGKGAEISDLSSVESILANIKDLPNYEELVADARESFKREGLEIPNMIKETAMQTFLELYHNKPQEVDMVLNMIDEVYGTEAHDRINQLLKKKGVNTDDPEQIRQDLLSKEEGDVHRLTKAVKQYVKGSDLLDDRIGEYK